MVYHLSLLLFFILIPLIWADLKILPLQTGSFCRNKKVQKEEKRKNKETRESFGNWKNRSAEKKEESFYE